MNNNTPGDQANRLMQQSQRGLILAHRTAQGLLQQIIESWTLADQAAQVSQNRNLACYQSLTAQIEAAYRLLYEQSQHLLQVGFGNSLFAKVLAEPTTTPEGFAVGDIHYSQPAYQIGEAICWQNHQGESGFYWVIGIVRDPEEEAWRYDLIGQDSDCHLGQLEVGLSKLPQGGRVGSPRLGSN